MVNYASSPTHIWKGSSIASPSRPTFPLSSSAAPIVISDDEDDDTMVTQRDADISLAVEASQIAAFKKEMVEHTLPINSSPSVPPLGISNGDNGSLVTQKETDISLDVGSSVTQTLPVPALSSNPNFDIPTPIPEERVAAASMISADFHRTTSSHSGTSRASVETADTSAAEESEGPGPDTEAKQLDTDDDIPVKISDARDFVLPSVPFALSKGALTRNDSVSDQLSGLHITSKQPTDLRSPTTPATAVPLVSLPLETPATPSPSKPMSVKELTAWMARREAAHPKLPPARKEQRESGSLGIVRNSY